MSSDISSVDSSVKKSSVKKSDKSAKSSPANPYIMRGGNSISDDVVVRSSFDTMHLSCRIFWQRPHVLELLAQKKREVQSTDDTSIPVKFAYASGFEWNLQRTGVKLFSYVLKSGDITLMLSPRKGDANIPNCKIEIGSMSCWSGSLDIYQRIQYWMSVCGAEIRSNTVSRADLAADFVGLDLKDTLADRQEYWVCRARNFASYHQNRKLTGVQWGRGDVVLRIYDKTEELKKNATKSQFFRDIWGQPGKVTRVEFQARRKALKEFKPHIGPDIGDSEELFGTIEDLHKNIDLLWKYFSEWACQKDRPVDRENNNQSTLKTSWFWQLVESVSVVSEKPVRVGKSVKKDIDKLKKQARGLLLSIVASDDLDSNDVYAVLAKVKKMASDVLMEYIMADFTEYQKKYDQRRIESGAGKLHEEVM